MEGHSRFQIQGPTAVVDYLIDRPVARGAFSVPVDCEDSGPQVCRGWSFLPKARRALWLRPLFKLRVSQMLVLPIGTVQEVFRLIVGSELGIRFIAAVCSARARERCSLYFEGRRL